MGGTRDMRLEFPVRLPVILEAVGMLENGPSVTLDVEISSTESEAHLVPFWVCVLDFYPTFYLFHSLHKEA